MGQSAGAGSPAYFACPGERQSWRGERHDVQRTGMTRPYRAARYQALGIRSLTTSHQYRCTTCGHEGWTNHMDILKARLA